MNKTQAGNSAAPRAARPSGSAIRHPEANPVRRVEFEAVENDLREAREMAAEFQRQLALKTNELAQQKQILEKTQGDLSRLQAGIVGMRKERHRIAGEAMRSAALDRKLTAITEERDELRRRLDASGTEAAAAPLEAMREREAQVAELTLQVLDLKAALAEAHRQATDPKWIG